MEEWREYNKIPNLWVSNMGNVRFLCPKKKVNINILPKHYGKYHCIKIKGNDSIPLHTLVAETFIPNIDFKSHVRHINGNTKDNRVENLEWSKRNSGKKGGRPRKNSEGITISTATDTTWERTLDDVASRQTISEVEVLYDKYVLIKMPFSTQWHLSLKNDDKHEHIGFFDSKEEAEMALYLIKTDP